MRVFFLAACDVLTRKCVCDGKRAAIGVSTGVPHLHLLADLAEICRDGVREVSGRAAPVVHNKLRHQQRLTARVCT